MAKMIHSRFLAIEEMLGDLMTSQNLEDLFSVEPYPEVDHADMKHFINNLSDDGFVKLAEEWFIPAEWLKEELRQWVECDY